MRGYYPSPASSRGEGGRPKAGRVGVVQQTKLRGGGKRGASALVKPHALSAYASSTTYGPPPVDARDEYSTKREALKVLVGK
jgi:hypothetical protein